MKEREEDFLRETKGINTNAWVSAAFDKGALDDIHKSPPVDVLYSEFIFCTADPNAGGSRSRFAIVSAIYDAEGNMVVSILFFSQHPKIPFLSKYHSNNFHTHQSTI
jgi:hypothetical protein